MTMTVPPPRATAAAAGHRVTMWRWQRGGSTLVLLHGFTGRAEIWDRVVGALPLGTSVLGVNLSGHDPLTPADPARGFDGAVDALAQCVAALGAPRVHLVGYSLGARLALGLGARHPALVGRATLVGVHPGLQDAAARAERRARDAGWATLLRTSGAEPFARAWEEQPLFSSQAALPDDVLEEQRRIRASHDPGQLACSLEETGLAAMPDLRPALGAMEFPVRLVVGEHDRDFRGRAEEILPLFPRADLRIVPGAGHNVPLEAPGALAALL